MNQKRVGENLSQALRLVEPISQGLNTKQYDQHRYQMQRPDSSDSLEVKLAKAYFRTARAVDVGQNESGQDVKEAHSGDTQRAKNIANPGFGV